MAQRPTRGTAPVQKPNPVPHEEDAAPKPQEKPQAQGAIAVVKSKIREKDAPRQEEDSPPGAKVTSSKITPRPKKHKRGSSLENAIKDEGSAIQKTDTKSEKIDLKSEESKPETDVRLEIESKLEENQAALQESKSKKSVAKLVQSKKSLGPTEDEQTEGVEAKKSELKRDTESFVAADLLSKTVLSSPESQEQKPENQPLAKNIQSDFSQSTAKKSFTKQSPPQQKIERKNYLANLSPEPLDEYPADEEESKDQANKKRDSVS